MTNVRSDGEVSVHQPIVGWVVAGLDIWAVASLFQPRLSNLPSSGFKTQKERKIQPLPILLETFFYDSF